jgi:uncharacterized membrane protein
MASFYSILASARWLARFTCMSGAEFGLSLSVFLASAVECVEALTIVLAVGVSRGWPSSLAGVGAALLALAAIVLVLGTGLGALPIGAVQLVVGALLLLFGFQWLRKAVLRQAGLKAMRDETVAFGSELEAARAAERSRGSWDPYSFAISFKGVLLEGLEVALIVVTLGASHHEIPLAAAAAGLAALLVLAAGLVVRRPLARVPENTLKYAVGVMLSSFGVFWGVEGLGGSWPGGEAMLPAIVLAVLGGSLLAVRRLRATAAAFGA